MFAIMTIQAAIQYSIEQLKIIYKEGEAIAITNLVIENLTTFRLTDGHYEKEKTFSPEQVSHLNNILERLLTHEPVQYVLNESWFYSFKFYVDRNVLIPRSETEELVEWIIADCKSPTDDLKILDIGTGSGCIPITLKKELQKPKVWSCDISEEALQVAKKNTVELDTDINFLQLNFLDKQQWQRLPRFDLIVSNPPYVPEKDKVEMKNNVLEYEPATALFVPDNNPLVFYIAIAEFGKTHLNKKGNIYLEIHESLGEAIIKLFRENGYATVLKKDMQGKDRMIKAALS